MADFDVLNSLENWNLSPQDLILFRNLHRLVATLRPGGFLVVGAAEIALQVSLELLSLGHSIYFKRPKQRFR